MAKRALGVAVGLALLIGFSRLASAEPVRMNYECTCTCVATDKNGNRVEGGETFTFQTSGNQCSVGQKTGCFVGEHKGTYASCTGRDLSNPPKPAAPPGGAATRH